MALARREEARKDRPRWVAEHDRPYDRTRCSVGMQRMGHAHARFGAMMDVPLTLRSSDYVRRQVWLTFLDDPVGAASLESLGSDTFMWGSDFRHTDSTWPKSHKIIEKDLAGVPARVARKVLRENAAALYPIELPAPA